MKEYMIPIGNRIASEIKRTGLTQEQVGKALGVSRWCCTHKGISVKNLMQLCLLLDCSADYILFGGALMDDLISRSKAIRWVKAECNPYGQPTLDYESAIKVIEHLERMPSEQAEKRSNPQGRSYHKM